MRKIDYSKVGHIREKYLQFLGLKNENNQSTERLVELQKKWDVKRQCITILSNVFPKIEDILIADYQELVKIYLEINSNTLSQQEVKELQEIFNYNKYSKLIALFFVKYNTEFDITSCFYCETAYINVFPDKANNRRTFDLDHFFPNKESPLTVLSLFNFVPCCQICNSRIKGRNKFEKFYNIDNNSRKDFVLRNLSPCSPFYNYGESVNIKVLPKKKSMNETWHYVLSFSENIENYEIEFINNDKNECYARVTNAFKLKERYNYINNKKEALFLLDLKLKYPHSKLQSMSKILRISIGELEEIIFQKETSKLFHRLFVKLRNDILS